MIVTSDVVPLDNFAKEPFYQAHVSITKLFVCHVSTTIIMYHHALPSLYSIGSPKVPTLHHGPKLARPAWFSVVPKTLKAINTFPLDIDV